MGITLQKLEELRGRGLFAAGCRVLDIGSSNLYSADRDGLRSFLARYGVSPDDTSINQISNGSGYGPAGGANQSFIGEVLEQAGLTYLSFDIAKGYRTRIFDLNTERIPDDLMSSFDTVLNFGTTEHVFDQLNAFRVIHDATKVGGYIVHDLPMSGYVDHGYFCYTPRFLFDLSGHNEYEVIDFAYQGPVAGNDIYGIVRDYTAYFPALANKLPEYRTDFWSRLNRKLKRKLPEVRPDNISLYLVLRKVKEGPLKMPYDTSTSVHVAA
ncbi:hypothetical protein [Bradyrhizobium neotropicale]|uniref:hypothetical protein n=1 Tax=Bradyrhizobium neotropicale TaxID=1497615 RepID=UPI001AD77B1B|nr:hypothetical protein [Bradyrhizobium neotropicale]MBO4223120.1 hypothetical protein [Bradyrhizobium neotropicale]